jgi:hypothetical protein
LPVDGVNSESVQTCTELLNSRLENKFWPHSSRPYGVRLIQRSNQWYLTFYMDNDVRLSDVQAALEDSAFSIPQDRLRLFGHVLLEIEARPGSRPALLSGLEALPYVSVEESKALEDLLLVTLDMPYPVDRGNSDRESVGWHMFRRNDFNSNPSRTPATSRQLPGYENIRGVVSKHNASLKDIRWSTHYACRVLGGVAEARTPTRESGPNRSNKAALPVGKWNVEFANGVSEVCDIGAGGEAAVTEPQRVSHGTAAVEGGSVVIAFDDDRVERWTPVGKRLVVEHWFPGSRFPSTTPVLGIAERVP